MKVRKRFHCQNKENVANLNLNIKDIFLIHTCLMHDNVYNFSKQMRGFPVCDIGKNVKT